MYVFDDHLGAAVYKAKEYAKVAGLRECEPVEAFPISRIGYRKEPEDTERLADGVFLGKSLNTFEEDELDSFFSLPAGILRSAADGILEPEPEEEFVAALGPDEEGFFTLTVVLASNNLEVIFFSLANLLQVIDKLFLAVKDYNGDPKATKHWESALLSGKESILGFIKENKADTLDNGFVELSLYVLEGETCMRLGDDKILTLTTRDERLFKFLHTTIKYYGIREGKKQCMPRHEHWRYRPYNSLDIVPFQELLVSRGFKEVENKVKHISC